MLTEQELIRKHIMERMTKAMREFQLINDDDKILIAISGGKDSLCLTEMLGRRSLILKPRFQLHAVHVRMKDVNYETDTSYLKDFCQKWKIPLHLMTTHISTNHEGKTKPPCFLCSWNRRKQIFNLAQELGCNKIALGHHMDDIVQTALMNICFQGRFDSMPPLLKMEKMPITLIRPLCLCMEQDIKKYAELAHYYPQRKLCPHENTTNRNNMKLIIRQLEKLNPELRYSVWSALKNYNK